ncbi:MAG: PorP/SprF family type IX secretion system membrane protein [Candidatus Amulumruptor sp.]|nr:PorP/SprF family type IX secretion system membrane protein [Candidatus Amulumruptor sp.]
MIQHGAMNLRVTVLSIIAVVALCAVPWRASAQYNEPLLGQYYEMPAFYNPGAIGLSDRIRVRAGARLQWIGINRAPVSVIGTADMPLKLGRRRMAVGLSLQQESYGLFRNFTGAALVGYKVMLLGGTLTPGLRIGLLNQSFRGSEVYIPDDDDYHQSDDDAIPTVDVGGNALDLGLGLHYERRGWYAGAALLHANAPTVSFNSEGLGSGTVNDSRADGTDDSTAPETTQYYEFPVDRTLYFIVGGNIPVKNTLIEVMPSVIAVSDFNDFTGIATCRLRYNKLVSGGLSYRYREAVALHLGVELKNFYAGYTYEYPVNDIGRASSGSHELIAGYSFKLDLSDKNRNKQKSIRIL